jgi:hypothetical protein
MFLRLNWNKEIQVIKNCAVQYITCSRSLYVFNGDIEWHKFDGKKKSSDYQDYFSEIYLSTELIKIYWKFQ